MESVLGDWLVQIELSFCVKICCIKCYICANFTEFDQTLIV